MSAINVSLNFIFLTGCDEVQDDSSSQDAQVAVPDVIADGAGGSGGSPVDMGATGADGSGGTPPLADSAFVNLDAGRPDASPDMSFVNPADARSVDASVVDAASIDAAPDAVVVPPPPPAPQTHLAVTESSFAPGSNSTTQFYNLTTGQFEAASVQAGQDAVVGACGTDVFVVDRGVGRVLAFNKNNLGQNLWTVQFSAASNPQNVACDRNGNVAISLYNPDREVGEGDVEIVSRGLGAIRGGVDLSGYSPQGYPRASALVCGADHCFVALQHLDEAFVPAVPGTLVALDPTRMVDIRAESVELEGLNPVAMTMVNGQPLVVHSGNYNDNAGGLELVDPVNQTAQYLDASEIGAFAPGAVVVDAANAYVMAGFPTNIYRVPLTLDGGEVVYTGGDFDTGLGAVNTDAGTRIFVGERGAPGGVVEVSPAGGAGQPLVGTDPAPSALVGF